MSTGFNWMGQTNVANVNLWACVKVFGKGAVLFREILTNKVDSKEKRWLKYVVDPFTKGVITDGLVDKRNR